MKTCEVERCDNKVEAKGYCHKHYLRQWRHGDPLYTEREMHGMYDTPEYRTWRCIKLRCYNKNNARFHRYGGRGIIVCDRWLTSFLAFFADMGLKPSPKAQIDRIDNDGNYEPGNCRWVTRAQNSQHTRTTKLTMQKVREIRKRYKTEDITQKALSFIYKIDRSAISRIINNKRWQICPQ